jgi:hypothetical protein
MSGSTRALRRLAASIWSCPVSTDVRARHHVLFALAARLRTVAGSGHIRIARPMARIPLDTRAHDPGG